MVTPAVLSFLSMANFEEQTKGACLCIWPCPSSPVLFSLAVLNYGSVINI